MPSEDWSYAALAPHSSQRDGALRSASFQSASLRWISLCIVQFFHHWFFSGQLVFRVWAVYWVTLWPSNQVQGGLHSNIPTWPPSFTKGCLTTALCKSGQAAFFSFGSSWWGLSRGSWTSRSHLYNGCVCQHDSILKSSFDCWSSLGYGVTNIFPLKINHCSVELDFIEEGW